ncbi:MAG: phage/plasmid primase, P4 family [Trueperella sp.]|uniref:DNA primase family protein n=1 Tax=Trueperella sp. TaxID=2699835 RepID=UPI0025D2EDE5|nr:phage/plasmid primase, P4 family [Trueperella sp.]MCI7306450.1 phage/plasmid primase, P4 family [Trueperella sp.]
MNQVYSEEVELFFMGNQAPLTPMEVENALINQINSRFLTINTEHGLKGARAYRPIQALPAVVIAECLLRRDLPHTGLLGESAATAALVTYCAEGPDEGLYVPAERLVRTLARAYHYSISPGDLKAVVELIKDSVPLLVPSEDGDVVALANGLFDLRSKELHPFSPEVVLTSKASVAFNDDATTCPIIDGWTVDEWIRELANDDPEVEELFWQIVAALFRPGHAFNKAVLLYSPTGSNGKGTFLELLRNLVGADRVATLAISDFGNPFLPETLRHAFCVLSDEGEVGDFLRRSGVFKAWITHDWIRLNVKYGSMSDIKGRGLCVFCVNELPSSKDKSESFYRRFVAIPFFKRYIGAEENTAIKNDYVKRREVLEYVAKKALMMPLFDAFVTPDACSDLLEDIRVENDPVLQFAEEFLPQFRWDLLPWKFVYAVYAAWMRKEVPSGHPVSAREFNKRMTSYVEANPACGWTVPVGEDGKQKTIRTHNKILGEEPLAVEYDLSDWFDMRPVNGSIRKIGIPHNMPVSTRGLLRTTVVLSDDDTDEDHSPAPQEEQPSNVLVLPSAVSLAMSRDADEIARESDAAAAAFLAGQTI